MNPRSILLLLQCCVVAVASSQEVNYSPAYFGPNANPVPPLTDATIPEFTTVQAAANYFFGFGDRTGNADVVIEIPFVARRVSLKVWTPFLEYYAASSDVAIERTMSVSATSDDGGGGGQEFYGNVPIGDIYVQTRINLLSEKKFAPAIVLNVTLKTAAVTRAEFVTRRYFDTPGYYFDVEMGKSFHPNSLIINELRIVAGIGFLCWETTESLQNDAQMYGAKVIAANDFMSAEASISGYQGWIGNGDAPLVFSARVNYKRRMATYFVEYQRGLRDFPYHHLRGGVAFALPALTPRYKD
jgi:hypothetical protein